MVKYLLEEAKFTLSFIDKQGRTVLDIAVERNHTEVAAYLREYMVLVFQGQRKDMQAKLSSEFESRLAEPIRQIQENSGDSLDFNALNPNKLATLWLDQIEAIIQGTWSFPIPEEKVDEIDPDLNLDVNAFLEGIQEGLQQYGAEVPEIYRDELQSFSVESLRPYAIWLIKQWKDAYSETTKEPEKEDTVVSEDLSEIELESSEEPTKQESAPKEKEKKISNIQFLIYGKANSTIQQALLYS